MSDDLSLFRLRLSAKQMKILLATLRDVVAHGEHVGQPYFLNGGALMGYVRYGHMLPWDDDIDLHCHGTVEVDEQFAAKKKLRVRTTRNSVQFRKRRCRLMVEVFPLINHVHRFGGKSYNYRGITETQPVNFMGVTVGAPVSPERLLDARYGVSWRTTAVSPKWDHLKRRRIKISVLREVGSLEPIVTKFRERHVFQW